MGMTLVKTIALVGMMGVGKTSIGKRLAARLEVPFADADHEIEAAAKMEVKDIFAKYGEPEFRRLERNVIARLLAGPPHVLASGGGAFMDETTRAAMRGTAFSIWLRAPIDTLVARVKKRQAADQSRPLLAGGDMRATLEKLLETRGPVYATADMVLDSGDEPHAVLVEKVVAALHGNQLCEAP
jgi:shikimate kinase